MSPKRPFFSTTFFTLLGRLGGLLIPFFISMVFGAGRLTDAFFFAYGLIFASLNIFSYIFQSSLVPFLVERKKNPEQAVEFTLGALSLGLPLFFFITLGLVFSLPTLLNLRSSMIPETSMLISRLFLEMLPGLFIAILISAYHGLFYAYKIFWFPSVSTLIRTATMVLFFLLGWRSFGIHCLTWGFVAGEILRWLAAHILLTRNVRFKFKIPAGEFQKVLGFFQQAFFQVLAIVAINIMPLADQWAAAPLGAGKLSLFNYADRLLQVPHLLFLHGFTQVFFSFWSDSHVHEGTASFFDKVRKDMRVVFAGALILVIVMEALSNPVTRIIFHRSHLTKEQLRQLEDIFQWLALGFLPGILRILYGRVLIIIKKSKTYFYQAWLELLGKITLNFLFSTWFGITGIAMATTVIYSLTAFWFYFYIKAHPRSHLSGLEQQRLGQQD